MKWTTTLMLLLVLGVAVDPAKSDFTFGSPVNLGSTVNSASGDAAVDISADGLELYFVSDRPGSYGGWDIYVATRSTTDDAWGEPVNLGSVVNGWDWQQAPNISADGLTLLFGSTRSGGVGDWDIWMTTRPTVSEPWGPPVNLGEPINSAALDRSPCLSADGLTLFFDSTRSGGSGSDDLWVATRATTQDNWGTPVNLGSTVNSPASEGSASLSADGLTLFFSSYHLGPFRPGSHGGADLWVTTRTSLSASWGAPMNLGATVNSMNAEFGPSVSADGTTLFFSSLRGGGFGPVDLWQAPISPMVDFNSDGSVNIRDLLRLIDSWGQDDRLCDIWPTMFGDGAVDAGDLEVLMSYWGHEVQDGTLAAHWKLDETEGMIVSDSAGNHDATVIGLPSWAPAGGAVGGALRFNGMTFVVAGAVLNPLHGPFSVIAWVNGGAPGQVIISQQADGDWLMCDPATGALMTEAKGSQPLYSDVTITDGAWHRVAVTWDGSTRRLCVDDILVAEDTGVALADCTGDLSIGCGKLMAPGTFFTGLIDDVRIYNRAVKP